MSRLRNWFLSSPPAEYAITSLKELLIGALQQGPVPQHVAFVMDGTGALPGHMELNSGGT
jgi:hypothetical protein